MTYSTSSRDLFKVGTSVVTGSLVVATVGGAGWLAGQAARVQAEQAAAKQTATTPTSRDVVRVHWRHLPTITRTVVKHTYSTVKVPVYIGGGTSSSSSSSSSVQSSGGGSHYSGGGGSAPVHSAPPAHHAPAPSSGS